MVERKKLLVLLPAIVLIGSIVFVASEIATNNQNRGTSAATGLTFCTHEMDKVEKFKTENPNVAFTVIECSKVTTKLRIFCPDQIEEIEKFKKEFPGKPVPMAACI